jgi:xylulokinase
MSKKIIAYDLGTGGNKASLYDEDGMCLASVFVPYETIYPNAGWHEQRPSDWWRAVVESTRGLLAGGKADLNDIECVSISGHSLGVVPLDRKGELLRETTPIWSDTRAEKQTGELFGKVSEEEWYMTTGNGFPPPCYSVFKLMWYRENEQGMFRRVHRILGTKDYVNFRMTGKLLTDYSYASGSGAYDLRKWDFSDKFLGAAGVPREMFPELVPSTRVVGELTKEASGELGLPRRVRVVCGGVDNSCMALGARNIAEGRVYTSLGSSSWIAVSSGNPVLDYATRPFVFTHVMPGMFTSAVSIFAAGSSLAWVKDTLCRDLASSGGGRSGSGDAWALMNQRAARSPVGAKKLLFNPSLAGGSSQEATAHIRGAFSGIDLGHTQDDVIRSCMEGVAMNLAIVLDVLRRFTKLSEEMVMVGGGSKSRLWLQIFADCYNMGVVKTNVGQDAGSLGAAAVGAVGSGLWKDFGRIDEIHKVQDTVKPIAENVEKYRKLRPAFEHLRESQARLGDILHGIEL